MLQNYGHPRYGMGWLLRSLTSAVKRRLASKVFGISRTEEDYNSIPLVRTLVRSEMRDSINAMMDSYFASIPKGIGIAIEGYGTFTVDELRDEVRRGTPVGDDVKRTVARRQRFEQLRRRPKAPDRAQAAAQKR